MSSDDEFVILSDSEGEDIGARSLPTTRNKRKIHAANISQVSAGRATRSKKKSESIIILGSSDDESDDDNELTYSASSNEGEESSVEGLDVSLAERMKKRRKGEAPVASIGSNSSNITMVDLDIQIECGEGEEHENAESIAHRSITPTSNADDNATMEEVSLMTNNTSSSSQGSVTFGSMKLDSVPRGSRSVVQVNDNPVTQKDCTAYIKSLEKNVKKRKFPLSDIPSHEVIPTGRTIKPLKGWSGHWPALREFLQNTVDHLSLMDGKTGRRRACLDIKVEKASEGGKDGQATIAFMCQDTTICKFLVSPDELIIEQWYTYPIASRAMDTGVVDTTKSSDSAQAGGFGDGFKTAATALIANSKGKDFDSLKWCFYAISEKTQVTWRFEGLTKDSVATFAKCQVLQVAIDKSEIEIGNDKMDFLWEKEGVGRTRNAQGDYVMRQFIKVKNIGKTFLERAVPQFAVFWDLDDQTLISTQRKNTRGLGGDFLGPALEQPKIFGGELGNIKPQSGVYVRGIWVRKSKIKDALMCFYGSRLEVIGRDRNDVDEDELLDAVTYVLTNCNNLDHLEELLSPLRHVGPTKKGGEKKKDSWLLKPVSYFNRVIEAQREFILHDVLRVPQGSIFISNKTSNGRNNPFFSWASDFLRKHGTPLIPIERGANKYLFEEVNEYQLTERCVHFLRDGAKGKRKQSKDNRQLVIRKFLNFMGMKGVYVVPSKDVMVAFSHDRSLYVPESKLNRDRIVMIVNVCHSTYEGAAENYSSLVQALVETLPAMKGYECSAADADKVVLKAKRIKKDASDFLHCREEEDAGNQNKAQEPQNISKDRNKIQEPQNIADRVRDIDEEIKVVVNKNKIEKIGDDSKLSGGAFAADNAGNEDCIRPSSDLTDIRVDNSLGGGNILFDRDTVAEIKSKSFPRATCDKIVMLRSALEDACQIIQHSIPSTKELLTTIRVGYDGQNDGYEAFCDGSRIVVNLFAYLPKVQGLQSPSRSLVHDLVITVTHELAHMLKPDAGHGPVWRDTHMKMIIPVMNYLQAL